MAFGISRSRLKSSWVNDGSLGSEAGGCWASGEEDGEGDGEETGSGETGETGSGRTDEKTGSGRAEDNGTTTADTLT